MKALRFLICALVALLLSAAVAGAQGKYKNVELTITHGDGRYQKNEKVEVWALKTEDDGENLTLTILENGQKTVDNSPLKLKPGKKTRILSRKYAGPTAVMLQVSPESDPKIFSAVGFIVDAEEFTPGFAEPADFADYWQDQVKKMRESEMTVKLTPAEIPADRQKYRGKVEAYDLEISMPEGNPVRAYIAWPVNAEPGSLGIMVCPHGAGVRSSNLNNVIWRAYDMKCIAIDINAHGIPNGQDNAYYEARANGELKNYRHTKSVRREDSYFRLMYLRMQRVLDYACTLKQWDGERVALEGGSQGGGQSAALAGLDSRVKFVILVVPALTDIGGPFAGHRGSWPYYGKFDEAKDGDYMYALPYIDAVNFLRHYNGTLIMEAGLIDTTCPPECVFAAYNVASSPDKTIATNPYRQHGEKVLWEPNYAKWRETIYTPRREALLNYLKK